MSLLKKSGTAFLAIWIAGSISPLDARERQWDDGYRVYQDHAPNFVQVEILNISVDSNKTLWFASSSDRVEIEARVLKVFRTEDNLAPGMMIPIVYDRRAAAGGTFAESPGIPEQGSVVPAFIKRKADFFIPAARHHTFEPLTEQQVARMKEKPEFLDPEQIAALQQPDSVLASARIDSQSGLPLKKPETANNPAPTAEVVETLEKLDATPSQAARDLDEPTRPTGVTAATDEIAVAAAPTSTPESMPEPKETGGSSGTPRSLLSPMPNVVPPDPEKQDEPRRRTVVVVPPSEIRARKAAEQSTPPILRQPAPQARVIEPDPEPQIQTAAETVSQPPASPSIALPEREVPAPRAAVVEAPAPEIPASPEPAPSSEPEVRSTIPAFSVREPQEPALRAEPVPVPSPTPEPASPPQPEMAEINPAPELPPEPATPENPTESVTDQVLAESSRQSSSEVSGDGSPANPIDVEEESIAITDFLPAPATPPTASEPAPAAAPPTRFPASDQENMKSYADIYGLLQNAESMKASKKLNEAKTLYEQALSGLQSMKQNFPDFQPFMVEYRIRDTGRKLEQIMMQINSNPDAENQPDQP